MMTSTLFRSISECEISALKDMYNAAEKDFSEKFGINVYSIGSACAVIAKNIDILTFNRVLGLGLAEPATEQMLDDIISEYRAAGIPRFFIQIHPEASPSQLTDWFNKRNIHHHNNWVKHYRGVEDPPEFETDLEIKEIADKNDAETFGEIIAKSFGWKNEMKNWFGNLVRRKYWKTYLAYYEGRPVATASLYVKDDCGWLSFASTLPEFREKGAQTALIIRRIQDAAEIGCKVLTVETTEDTKDQRSPALQNLQKVGFKVAYVRPNFIWKSA